MTFNSDKEAQARLKINKMLEDAGWKLIGTPAERNVDVEYSAKISKEGKDANGLLDYLLQDGKGFPLCVLEAKKPSVNPLFAKEQARRYAESQNVRFVILSNGDISYLWDIKSGNPQIITSMPAQESLEARGNFKKDKKLLSVELVTPEYIALMQNPNLLFEPDYINEKTRADYCCNNSLRILRPYQMNAISAIQNAVTAGKDRFLIEMATGLGKTLTSAAIIEMFLRTGNASRVLFLADRIELEEQAGKRDLPKYLKDRTVLIYKHNRGDWKKADVVVSTIQSLLAGDKYKFLFSPTDFDFIISDEAHRSIGGNSRAVFEYFIGYKLGLTATPKDYIKNIDAEKLKSQDPKALERRILLDTYKTFGCESGEPTYRYSLQDGVDAGHLISPYVLDTRTDITTELLSEEGYHAVGTTEEGEEAEAIVEGKDFEKRFYNENINRAFCKAFFENAERDPISGEIGKSLMFCVSQEHAAKITQILNEFAMQAFPGKYNSDFAKQVTSNAVDAQGMTVLFANNKLGGFSRFLEGYETSKTRVCVTVGMMTTGYDCSDLLNIAFMRPVFSPTDFVQMKGRGTRRHTFKYTDADKNTVVKEKALFKMFDFFRNCEYFEQDFEYDKELKLPQASNNSGGSGTPNSSAGSIISQAPDEVSTMNPLPIPQGGMRVDREFWGSVQKEIGEDIEIKDAVDNEHWDRAIHLVRTKYENKPKLFANLEKIKKANHLDRRVSWREVLEMIFGLIPDFKDKNAMLEDECDKFISIYKPDADIVPLIKNFIKAYILDTDFLKIIEDKNFPKLNFYAGFNFDDYRKLGSFRDILPVYIKDNINPNIYRE
ncbi:MAG: DEAD/DEAH box helicase family protein [Endomicrobia bacterium]|nr:DEAD/DEAH box helicase family protein [Endomicrobiia bacterium]